MLGSGQGSPDPDHTVPVDPSVDEDLASAEAGLRAIAAKQHRPPLERSPPGRRTGSSLLRESERDQPSCHARCQGATELLGTLLESSTTQPHARKVTLPMVQYLRTAWDGGEGIRSAHTPAPVNWVPSLAHAARARKPAHRRAALPLSPSPPQGRGGPAFPLLFHLVS